MTKGTVLIFAHECYPYNRSGSAIGAQRPYQFAKNLADLGWKVIVLCSDKEQRRVLKKNKWHKEVKRLFQKDKVALQESSYLIVPLPSLTSYGVSDFIWSCSVEPGPGNTYRPKRFPFSVFRKAATFYGQLFHGDYSRSWVPVAAQYAELLLQQQPVDVIIGEHSPDAGIILAHQFSKRHDIPWIADFRDPVLRFFSGTFAQLYRKVVKRLVASAEATIAVSDHWSKLDEQLFQKKSYVIWNGFDNELMEHTSAHVFSSFTVSYFGSFDQSYQDVQPSLQAFATFLKNNHYPLDAKIVYRGLSSQEFLLYSEQAGIPSAHLDVDGFCSREQAVAYMKGSQVLLLYCAAPAKTSNVYEQHGLYPGKLFEYIGARRPMLLFPTDHDVVEALINGEHRGKATAYLEEAIAFLQQEYVRWTEQKSSKMPVHTPANDFKYSRQAQAAQLDQILSTVLSEKKKAASVR